MKLKNVLSLLTNVLLTALGAFPVVTAILANPATFDYLSLFTDLFYLTACLLTLMGLWGVIINIVSLARNKEVNLGIYHSFRLATLITALLNVGLLVYSYATKPIEFEIDLRFISSIVIPLCLLIVYLFLDTTTKKQKFLITLPSLLVPLIYFGVIIGMKIANIFTISYPYPFMEVFDGQNIILLNLLITLGFSIAPFVVAILLWLVSNSLSKKYRYDEEAENSETAPSGNKEVEQTELTKEEVKEEKPLVKKSTKKTTKKVEEPVEEETKTTSKKPVTKKETKKVPTKTVTTKAKVEEPTKKVEETKPSTTKESSEPTYRIYHITKRTDVNMWQVKYAKGLRAIKLFKTQQEAIDFAKELAAKNGASIRLHGVNGKIRKL